MDIKIDHSSIDFTLEQEQTVGEVIAELQPFIERHARTIATLAVDDEPLAIDDPAAWQDRELDPIERIQIETAGPFDRQIQDLGTVIEYFALLRSALHERNIEAMEEILQELPHIRGAVGPLSGESPADADRPQLLAELDSLMGMDAGAGSQSVEPGSPERLPGRMAQHLAEVSQEQLEALGAALDRISVVLETRRRELADPLRELGHTAEALSGYSEAMTEVPVLLQTGRDREAMERIARFSELTGKLMRLCSLAISHRRRLLPEDWDSQHLEANAEQLYAMLNELVEAFSAGDSVLIGDLVEYEIVPGLQELLQHIPVAGDES